MKILTWDILITDIINFKPIIINWFWLSDALLENISSLINKTYHPCFFPDEENDSYVVYRISLTPPQVAGWIPIWAYSCRLRDQTEKICPSPKRQRGQGWFFQNQKEGFRYVPPVKAGKQRSSSQTWTQNKTPAMQSKRMVSSSKKSNYGLPTETVSQLVAWPQVQGSHKGLIVGGGFWVGEVREGGEGGTWMVII